MLDEDEKIPSYTTADLSYSLFFYKPTDNVTFNITPLDCNTYTFEFWFHVGKSSNVYNLHSIRRK